MTGTSGPHGGRVRVLIVDDEPDPTALPSGVDAVEAAR